MSVVKVRGGKCLIRCDGCDLSTREAPIEAYTALRRIMTRDGWRPRWDPEVGEFSDLCPICVDTYQRVLGDKEVTVQQDPRTP